MKTLPPASFIALSAARGFTLVMTLSILAAVTILVVGLFSIVSRERLTSSSFDAVEQADIAVQAGLENAGMLLKEALRDENGLIMAVPTAPWITLQDVETDPERLLETEEGRAEAATLMAVRRQTEAGSLNGFVWSYTPLVSGVRSSETIENQIANPDLAELRQIPRPVVPGTYANGQPTFAHEPRNPQQTVEQVRELKRAAQRAAAVTPWRRTPSMYWVELQSPLAANAPPDSQGETVARFAFYIEDLQGLSSLGVFGNNDPAAPGETPSGWHTRAEPRLPNGSGVGSVHAVPGLNLMNPALPRLNQASLHTLLQPGADARLNATPPPTAALGALHRSLVSLRPVLFSPESWREAVLRDDPAAGWTRRLPESLRQRSVETNNVQAGLSRGSLIDAALRGLEEHTTAGLPAYDELALIPHEPGIVKDLNARKLNLNRLLNDIQAIPAGPDRETKKRQVVNQIADHIQAHLPNFATNRAGGYPFPNPPVPTTANMPVGNVTADRARAYLRCLAAGMIDYADTDSLPTMDGNPFVDPNANAGRDYPTYRGTDAYPLVSEQWQRYRLETGAPSGTLRWSVTTYLELWNLTNQDIAGEVAAAYECTGDVPVGFVTYAVENSLNFVTSGKPESIMGPGRGVWHRAIPLNPPLRPNEYRVIAFPPVVYDFPTGPGVINSVTYAGRDGAGNDWRSRYRLLWKPPGERDFVLVDQPLRPLDRNQRTTSTSSRQFFNTTNPAMSHGNRVGNRYQNNLGDVRAAFFLNDLQALVTYENGSSPWARNVRDNIKDRMYGQNRVYLWPDGGHDSLAPATTVGSLTRNPDDRATQPARHSQNNLAERQKFVQWISNRGFFDSVTELGHIYDPLMWDPNGGDEHNELLLRDFASIRTGNLAAPSHRYGGGSTLRIGRPEHERFRIDYSAFPAAGRPATRQLSATTLLDLFHCGIPESVDEARRLGDLLRIHGHVNLNTASRDTLRALVAGRLVMDPQLKLRSQDAAPNTPVELQPPTSRVSTSASDIAAHADLIADSIIRYRPYLTPAEVPEKVVMPTTAELAQRPLPRGVTIENTRGRPLIEREPLLGATIRANTDRDIEPEWNDAAAEEAFARIFNSSTVRSRNFKVVITGQSVRRTRSGDTKVLATRSRLYHVFIRPIRDANGNLIRQQTEITYARTL